MSSTGNCFVVLQPNCEAGTLIFGRNGEDASTVGEATEVCYYDSNNALEGKSDGGAEPEVDGKILRLILQKPRIGIWGGDSGANECNVVVAISWADEDAIENDSGHLNATDIVRYSLASAENAANAVTVIGSMVEKHGTDNGKINLIVCDPTEIYEISCCGKLWAAQCFAEGFRGISSNGLSVTTTIDKSSEGLSDALKTLGLWNGEGDLNFAACFGAQADDAAWSGTEPAGDGSYALTSMFETLRSAAKAESSRSAIVSVLAGTGISCHWFTATPNVNESVFKPFVFAPNCKISPLTKVSPESNITLLHKLHAQRKPTAVEDLKALESSCVEEVSAYLAEHIVADEELDELMKDCVEAEVKFYR